MNPFAKWISNNHPDRIILILLLTISPYIFLAFFAVPSADDFWQSALALKEGMGGFIVQRYFTWSGRFASDAFIAAFNVVGENLQDKFLIHSYFILPTFLISIYFLANYLLLSFLGVQKNPKWKIIFSLVSMIFMLSNVELRSTIFWLAGGATYTLANALFLISLGLTLSTIYIHQADRQSALWASLNVILIFLINGFNEAIMLANTAVITCLLCLSLVFRTLGKQEYLRLLAFEVSAVISTLIVVLAPGNAVRAAKDAQETGSLLRVMIKSLQSTWNHVFDWINPLWFCCVLLLLFVLHYLWSEPLASYIRDRKKWLATVISLIVALYLSYFVRWYALGSEGPLRADATSHVIFFALTVFGVFFLFLKFDFPNCKDATRHQKRVLTIGLIFCLLSTAINFRPIKNDLLSLGNHYHYYQSIYPQLATAGPNADVQVQPEPPVSILRWKCYLTDDPGYWTNIAVARYFQVRSVTAIGADPPEPECGGVEVYQKSNRQT